MYFSNSDVEIFKSILHKIPNVNSFINIRTLKTACHHSNYDIVKLVLEFGINPNEENPTNVDLYYFEEKTTLESALAAEIPCPKIVKILLQYDANVSSECINLASDTNGDVFNLIYRSIEWIFHQKFEALLRSISSIENEVTKFLFKEIAPELSTSELHLIVSKFLHSKKYHLFEYISDYYGKNNLFEMIPFKTVRCFITYYYQRHSFPYLLEFYGKEKIVELIDFKNLTEDSIQYLLSMDIVENQKIDLSDI